MPKEIWGVDSAAKVTDKLYSCVVDNFGKPKYWGRYLSTVQNASDGLTNEEVGFLHEKNVKILLIYNNFSAAVGNRNGRVAALNATHHARRLGVPDGTFIFANIEKFFDVDEAWIRGWVNALYTSGYRPGIYADPSKANFNKAYCTAVSNEAKIGEQVVIWSQEPTPGATTKAKAPTYKPISPPCIAHVWAWQYGENAKTCPIDTNLMEPKLFQAIW
ncbi:glycoside hydrolase domain-containing protein [Bacillus seohaeanensis]|jgi:Domain of unknown function (DUF1906)|uniref:Glycoside hydrolase domain-containing protein n=1 Tax=Bacillus seohaeanensis TaxID=284580 RepID=A0ABW5RPY2_9BACI